MLNTVFVFISQGVKASPPFSGLSVGCGSNKRGCLDFPGKQPPAHRCSFLRNQQSPNSRPRSGFQFLSANSSLPPSLLPLALPLHTIQHLSRTGKSSMVAITGGAKQYPVASTTLLGKWLFFSSPQTLIEPIANFLLRARQQLTLKSSTTNELFNIAMFLMLSAGACYGNGSVSPRSREEESSFARHSTFVEVQDIRPEENFDAHHPMSSDSRSRNARGILVDHVKKTYENNAFPQAWRNLPEIPSSDEINPVAKEHQPTTTIQEPEEWNMYQRETFLYDPKLPHNIVDKPWPSKEAYLGAHYQIIREDSIASLRTAVAEFKQTPSMDESSETRIYTSVTFIGLQLSRIGVASRIEFSCERAGKRIRWDQSKRLVQGTLVALTPEKDMFKTICKVATVAARVIKGGLDQDPPTIDLFWGDIKDMVIDPVEKYVMVESRSGYFEASRHTMVAMQKLMTEQFSFSKELVDLDPSVEAPLYIQHDPIKNLSYLERSAQENDGLILLPSTDTSLSAVDVLTNFPKDFKCGMDQSQISACQNMITKRLAIVQGPPGTGKTFVSITALEVMIRNIAPGDPPIIVAAQTNHALDQLLNHVLTFEPEIVRLGGQSDKENIAIKKRTFYELGMNPDLSFFKKGLGASSRENRALCEELTGVLSPFLNDALLTANTLHEHGLITEGQRRSLEPGDWVVEKNEDNVSTEDLAAWLTESQLMKIPGAPPVNFGFPLEESDIEAEQLRALESEATDTKPEDKDSDFGLIGQWVPFGRKWTGKHKAHFADGAARRRLTRITDLYKIPISERGQFYRYFEGQMNKIVMLKVQEVLVKYERHVEDNYIVKSMFNIKLIDHLGIKVVGCTTTGLSKYRKYTMEKPIFFSFHSRDLAILSEILLSALEPRTLLIEEAAETLESKIIAGMMDSLQQLILVGDHKQLQASCTVQALQDEPYNLSISMFERLVNNGMPFVMLNHQRRMIPEVRKLLCIEPDPFYTDLHDHESVLDRINNRPPVPGMSLMQQPSNSHRGAQYFQSMGGRNAYFFSHNWMEQKTSEGSCFNFAEAQMIAGFYNYLVLNGISSKQITVLTFYNGQRKTIIKQLKDHHGLGGIAYFNVFTVDSYQGEENDIILLSMVRSNQTLGVGFLDNRNRLVVALSRARRGLYLFGNSITLTAAETTELALGARDPLFDPLLEAARDPAKVESSPAAMLAYFYVILSTTLESFAENLALEDFHVVMAALVIAEILVFATSARFPGKLSQSPTKSTIKSTESRGSGRRQVRFSEDPNPYTISDIRRNLPLTIDRVQTNCRQMTTKFNARNSNRRAISDQASSQSCRRGDSVKSTPSKNDFGSSMDRSQPPPLFRPYGHEPVVDKNHPGLKNWANYDARKADQEIDEQQRVEAARIPKSDPSIIMIKETYTPVVFNKDGSRIVDTSGRVRTRVNRAQADVSTDHKTAGVETAKISSVSTTGATRTQVKPPQKTVVDSREKARDTNPNREKSDNKKQKTPSRSEVSIQNSDLKRTGTPALDSKPLVKNSSDSILVPVMVEQPGPWKSVIPDSGGELSTTGVTVKSTHYGEAVLVTAEQPGSWRSVVPGTGAEYHYGDAAVEFTRDISGEGVRSSEGLDLLIDFENDVPQILKPSYNNIIDNSQDVTSVSVVSAAQNSVLAESDDLISF
ncbi:uncharacterized protein RCO7_08942 [Rhynchosporium graminicola]|uniref:Uncharacterized protein n=1 Tax=Rhynchosporium graminicola TaxID=2792576 RepID=A0A1E1KJZ6_9HELO|nr:uncharacterized protein RCO7_08942 [Rhynchosporium commune]